MTAEEYLRQKYGAHRGHYEWRAIEEAFNAGVAAEREECAVVCDKHAADYSFFGREPYESMEAGAAGCAAAIRARGEK